MATVPFSELLKQINPEDLEPAPEPKKLGPGSYLTQVCMAKHGWSRTGRDMYTVTLIVTEGEFAGCAIKWHLTIVKEHPQLLHNFFANMAKLGVSMDFIATTSYHGEIIRQIILTGAYINVTLEEGRNGFLDVVHARRVIVP